MCVLDLAIFAFVLFVAQASNMRESFALTSWSEGFYGQVRKPVKELFVTRRDEATPLSVKGMAYGEIGVTAVAVFGEVCGIYSISQEEVILLFLSTNVSPFTVDGYTTRHTPAFVTRRKRRASCTGYPSRASSDQRALHFCTSAHPSLR